MSILKEVLCVPSRIRALHSYFRRYPDPHQDSVVKRLFMPDALIAVEEPAARERAREMVKKCLKEGTAMGLFAEPKAGFHSLAPGLPDASLPELVLRSVFSDTNTHNHDFGVVISWYLTCDPLSPPGTWEGVERLRMQTSLGLQESARWGQVLHWGRFLGFVEVEVAKNKERVFPDPTRFLRRNLVSIVGKGDKPVPFGEVAERTRSICPAIDGEFLRSRADRGLLASLPGPQHLTAATAQAWLRLQDEGRVTLTNPSDARAFVFPVGDRSDPDRKERFSHVQLGGGGL